MLVRQAAYSINVEGDILRDILCDFLQCLHKFLNVVRRINLGASFALPVRLVDFGRVDGQHPAGARRAGAPQGAEVGSELPRVAAASALADGASTVAEVHLPLKRARNIVQEQRRNVLSPVKYRKQIRAIKHTDIKMTCDHLQHRRTRRSANIC